MGLGSNEHEGYTRLTIGIGKDEKGREHAVIGMRCKADTPGAKLVYKAAGEPALDKNGNEVFRLEYDFIEGRIVALENEDTDFGKFLNVSIRDGGQVYRLRMERGSRYWADFLMRLPMLNLGEEVRLSPYSIKEEGKKTPNQGIAMKQAGEKIARKWNKENDYAGGPPQAEYDEDEGEWKFGKRNRWLEENVLDPARGTLAKLVSPTSSPAIAVANSSNPDDDDLPF